MTLSGRNCITSRSVPAAAGSRCVAKFKGPFTVSVCVGISVTLSLHTMDFNRTIHSERDANSTEISMTLTLTLNSTLTVNGP